MIDIRRATGDDAASVAEVFLSSRRAALPTVPLVHPDDSVRHYVRDIWIAKTEGWVAQDGESVVGVMSLTPGWVDQLYIAPDRLGEGIGRLLLERAKERSDGELQLWTFQINDRARRFYERNGFEVAEMTDGSNNEERTPDVRYRWTRPG